MFNTKIWITFSTTGFHCWPKAPDNVKYLKQIHRHIFKFKIAIDVDHQDRALEFHTFTSEIKDLHDNLFFKKEKVVERAYDYHNCSCEMIADILLQRIIVQYPGRAITVTVSEDDENGGIASYIPDGN